MFAPGIALGHVIGRFGCLFAGCCFGKPTIVPWAITFHDSMRMQTQHALNVPLHPRRLLRGGRGGAHPDSRCWPPNGRADRSRSDALELHAAVRDLPLHHRVLPRRHRPRRCSHFLDVPVHLADARSAGIVMSVSSSRDHRDTPAQAGVERGLAYSVTPHAFPYHRTTARAKQIASSPSPCVNPTRQPTVAASAPTHPDDRVQVAGRRGACRIQRRQAEHVVTPATSRNRRQRHSRPNHSR